MAEPFGIVGVISLTMQIAQVVVQFGLDWKQAPHDVKAFLAELQTLKTILSETNTNLLLNSDFEAAFQNRHSLLLSQLGPNAPSTTDTQVMLSACHKGLESLLSELKKRAKGHRVGWERFKGAFLAKDTRESVEKLQRQCQTLNNMVTIDASALGASTYKLVEEARKDQQGMMKEQQEARKEQQDWHQARGHQHILNWLTPIDYAPQQSDFIARRQEGTGQWLLNSDKFQEWLTHSRQTLF
jgi:hypothetical protein